MIDNGHVSANYVLVFLKPNERVQKKPEMEREAIAMVDADKAKDQG